MRGQLAAAALAAAAQAACPGQKVLENPADPSAAGPWPVSSRVVITRDASKWPDGNGTITKRNIKGLEVWYPAVPGTEKGAAPYKYSQRDISNPNDQAAKIPDCPGGVAPTGPACCQYCPSYDGIWSGLPLDTEHGPYPVIVFIHGTAAWRSYMLKLAGHWASRGFVVVGADYPGITGHDMLSDLEGKIGPLPNQAGDTELLIAELESLADPRLAFLQGNINMTLLGITGHSAGGSATGTLSKSVGKVLIPMAGGGTTKRADSYSTLVLGGQNDTIVGGNQQSGYASSPTPKRHIAINSAGHETYTDLCWMAPAQGGVTGIGRACTPPILGSNSFEKLADQGCRFSKESNAAQYNLPEDVWPVARYATAGVFEETLLCDARMTQQLQQLPQKFGAGVLAGWQEDV